MDDMRQQPEVAGIIEGQPLSIASRSFILFSSKMFLLTTCLIYFQ